MTSFAVDARGEVEAGKVICRDCSRTLMAAGVLLLLIGFGAALVGPLEIYCFYLFSEGGRFHYEGFGVGSFMFGNIASQIVGYYVIAAVCIPLGYGHLKLRRWARSLSLALLWVWLVIGAPVSVVVFGILLGSKELSPLAALLALVFLCVSYLVLPPVLIRFYQSISIRSTLAADVTAGSWIEALPTPILVLSLLYLLGAVAMHLLILFNGVLPLFGVMAHGLPGIALLDASIACLLLLTWGTLRRRQWAWWAAVVIGGLFALSTVITLVGTRYAELLAVLAFPAREMEFLGGMPLEGYHFAILAGIPLIATWAIAALARRHFR